MGPGLFDRARFVKDGETIERLGPFHFIQKKKGHRLTTDTVLLVDFIPPLKESDTVLDLGTGTGAIPLMLAHRSTDGRITGVEIDPLLADCARRNVEANGLFPRIDMIEGDYARLHELVPRGAFSVVVANPPYVREGAGRKSPDESRQRARHEKAGGLAGLVRGARWALKPRGRLCMVFPVARIFELMDELRAAGLCPIRLRFLRAQRDRRARLFLVEAGEAGGLVIEESD